MEVLVSLVGAGPGDPSLLTVAGLRAIERADVVLHDGLVHPAVLAHARQDAEVIEVHESESSEVPGRLVAFAREGRKVCRLEAGDPFEFGHGAAEALALAEAGIPFQIVPGVSRSAGAAAYAGIPLTERPAGFSVRESTGTQSETIVFRSVLSIREDVEQLLRSGVALDTPAAVIQSGTRADQRVVAGTLEDIARRVEDAGLGEPVVVIVGAVARLREKLRWWDNSGLFGRRVLVTRAKEQAGTLLDALAERGAEPVMFAAIAFAPPTDPARVEQAVREVGEYDLAVFTSVNGVDRWFAAMKAQRRDARAMGRARVVAIGPATAAALERFGVLADAVPAEHRGEGAASSALELLAASGGVAGRRVLLARAEVARDALPDALREAGVRVDVVPVYRTVPAGDRDIEGLIAALRSGHIDAAMFTSSSTVDHVCDALGPEAAALLAPVAVATIGPITSDTARKRGLHVSVEAAKYTVPGLLAALERHYARRETP